MSDTNKAVFLSYASQDAEAARRIADALRAAGVEVWFDQSELVGGDAWDQKIRRHIKECTLLIPIISAATQARTEGYFRLEWRLADQRTHLMAKGRPFLLPVVIDGARDAEAHVPDSFTEVQWTRLPGGETPAKFCERVKKLLGGALAGVADPGLGASKPARAQPEESRQHAAPATMRTPRWVRPVLAGVVVFAIALCVAWRMKFGGATAEKSSSTAQHFTAETVNPEVAGLISRARVLGAMIDATRTDLDAAAGLLEQAAKLEPNNATIFAEHALIDRRYLDQYFDRSPARVDAMRRRMAEAVSLDATSPVVRMARAMVMVHLSDDQATRAEAVALLQTLALDHPEIARVPVELGFQLMHDRPDDALLWFDRAAVVPGLTGEAHYGRAQVFLSRGERDQALTELDLALKAEHATTYLLWKAYLLTIWVGKVEVAKELLDAAPATVFVEDFPAAARFFVDFRARAYDQALADMRAVSHDYIESYALAGPTAYYRGLALSRLGKENAAQIEWRSALAVVELRLADRPTDCTLMQFKALLLSCLGDATSAQKIWKTQRELCGEESQSWVEPMVRMRLLPVDQAFDWLVEQINKHSDNATAAELRIDPIYDSVRDDPRFPALLTRAEADPKSSPVAKEKPTTVARAPDQKPPSLAPTPAPDEKSLVVLPLENLSPDPADAFFTDGIHSEIISTLSRVTDLKVISRTTALAFKGTNLSLTEVARKLGVANVMAGSVRRAGNRVRIELELRRASDEALLWQSPKADRELKEIFDLQSDIADEVARALQARAAPGTNAGARYLTKNTAAYDLFMKGSGRYFSAEPGGFDQAIDFYAQALGLDPHFATAAFMLAGAHCNLFNQTSDFAVRVHHAAEARKWAEEAARLSPGDVGASAQAFYFTLVEQDYPRALAMSDKALLALPNDTGANSFRAFALSGLGREREALAGLNVALELDPLNRFCIINQWESLLKLRRALELRSEIARVRAGPVGKDGFFNWAATRVFYELDGTVPETIADDYGPHQVEWAWRGRHFAEGAALVTKLLGDAKLGAPDQFNMQLHRHAALQRLGREPEAAAAAQDLMQRALQMQAATEIGPSAKDGWMAQALARQGDAEGAVVAGRRYVEATPAERYTSLRWQREWELAGLLSYLHRTKESVALLGGLLRVPSGLTVARLRVDPDFDNLHDDPAFQALLADPKNSEPL